MKAPEGILRISALSWLTLALMVLLLPLRWLCAMLLAAGFHELCHWAVVRMAGGSVSGFRIHPAGASMKFEDLSGGAELCCAAAGPLGSLLLMTLADPFPRLALCGVCQGLYNLLPIYPMDGGRILRIISRALLTPAKAQRLCRAVEFAVRLSLILTGMLCLCYWKAGFAVCLICCCMAVKKQQSVDKMMSR